MEYLPAHHLLRGRMYQVRYPKITTGVTPVFLISNGLNLNLNYGDAVRILPFSGLPVISSFYWIRFWINMRLVEGNQPHY